MKHCNWAFLGYDRPTSGFQGYPLMSAPNKKDYNMKRSKDYLTSTNRLIETSHLRD